MDDGFAGPFMSINGFNSNSMLTTFIVSQGVVRGRQHRFRYRAKNYIGWGPFSENSAVLAATVPVPPMKPLYKSFTGSLLNLVIQPTLDHGGSTIIKYELWVDVGNDFTSSFSKVALYQGTAFEYSISPLDNLVRGRVYRFKTRALNGEGYSDYSDISYIAYGSVPNIPNAPTLVMSSRNAIAVAWLPPAVSDLLIKGYILSMDNGINGEFTKVFIGTNRPDILTFTSGDLRTGYPYRFYVQAMNENGISDPSEISTFYACSSPSGLATPLYVNSYKDTKTIRISWNYPADNGGCTILGFRMFRNDGTPNSDILTTEVTSLVNNDPSILIHTIDMSVDGVIGNIYKFKIRAINIMGTVDSNAISVALASLPSKPSTVPVSIKSGTNQYQLTAQIATFDSTMNGGSPILNYDIQYDDGLRGTYKSIITLSPIISITREINRGR
jgi:hypothetical protein